MKKLTKHRIGVSMIMIVIVPCLIGALIGLIHAISVRPIEMSVLLAAILMVIVGALLMDES